MRGYRVEKQTWNLVSRFPLEGFQDVIVGSGVEPTFK
jgi:hypothetical protein